MIDYAKSHMILKPPIRVTLGIALLAAACSKADLPMHVLAQDALLAEVGRIDAEYDWGGVYAWARDGQSFVFGTDSKSPLVWRPESGAQLELDRVPEMGTILGIGAGINPTSILCMHAVDSETMVLAEVSPNDGNVIRTLGQLPLRHACAALLANQSGDRVFSYSPGDPIHWELPQMIACEQELSVKEIDTGGIMFLYAMQWQPDDRSMVCIGSDENCGTGLEEGNGMGEIRLVSDEGNPERFIRSGSGGFGWNTGPESNQALVAFPQEMSVSPDGQSIVYLAFTNGIQRLGRLRTKEMTHARGHDVARMHDILHLSDELLLVSPQGEHAMLEIWDAKTFALIKHTKISAGQQLVLNHDRTRLAVIDDEQIRAYRCIASNEVVN